MDSDISGIIFGLVCFTAYFALIFGSLAVWVWSLVDAIKRTNYTVENDRITWIIVIALTGSIGSIIYYFAVKRKLDKQIIK
jgi:uncharacterized membrane protein